MKDFAGLMKQAQKMQEDMARVQAEIEAAEVEGASGAGLVTVVMNGKGEAKRVRVDPSLAKADEIEVLEDLLLAAMNDAKRKADALAQEKMQAATGALAGMLPPGFTPPF